LEGRLRWRLCPPRLSRGLEPGARLKSRLHRAARPAFTALALAAAASLASSAWALGLGRLSVQSALGEPLRAQIEVTSLTPEEASSLRLRVAPPESYRAAGVEFNPVLQGAQVTLVRTADGRPVLRVASDRPVTEPFVDIILELNWATGRLVREYTLLLDPPRNVAAAPAAASPAPAAAPVFTPAPPPRSAATAAPSAPAVPAAPAAPVASATAPGPASAPKPAAAPAAAGNPPGTVTVQRGDSLSRVAQRVAQPGVSLDQMLVGLFRKNPQAFVGDNMNRLRAGVVLTVPSMEEAKGIEAAQARQTVVAQSNDFAAYRQQLAGNVATASPAPARTAQGQVTAEVQDRKPAPSATPDKLTLSQAQVKPGAQEAQAAKDAASKDTAARVAELSRNVEELKRIQAQTAAVAAGAKASAALPSVPPAAPAATTAAAAASAPSPAAAPVAAAPSPAAVAASAPAPKPAGPAVAAQPPAVPTTAAPSFVDSLMENPALPYAGGVLALVLAGAGLYRMRGRFKKGGNDSSFLESRAQPDSFFGASGGQRIDTRDAAAGPMSTQSSSVGYSLSQLDAIGDVDPVAEADVYLAYGRDLQAEEILKEAMRATPDRLAVRTKLLEVYAKRRDAKAFELLATQVFAMTQGQGEEWTKAQELGRGIDADNPMYQAGGVPSGAVDESGQIREPLGASTLPHSVLSQAMSTQPPAAPPSSALDLELDLDSLEDLSSPAKASPMEATKPLSTAPSLDATVRAPAPADSGPSSRLDFDLGDLDFGKPDANSPAASRSGPVTTPGASGFGDLPSLPEGGDSAFEAADPLQRKIDLAEEFRQIGDIDGARDLLEEVVAQADGAVKAKAQGMLDRLG
jgi:pilus assembly protein FimV